MPWHDVSSTIPGAANAFSRGERDNGIGKPVLELAAALCKAELRKRIIDLLPDYAYILILYFVQDALKCL